MAAYEPEINFTPDDEIVGPSNLRILLVHILAVIQAWGSKLGYIPENDFHKQLWQDPLLIFEMLYNRQQKQLRTPHKPDSDSLMMKHNVQDE